MFFFFVFLTRSISFPVNKKEIWKVRLVTCYSQSKRCSAHGDRGCWSAHRAHPRGPLSIQLPSSRLFPRNRNRNRRGPSSTEKKRRKEIHYADPGVFPRGFSRFHFLLVSFSIWYSNRPLLLHMLARSSGRHERFIVLTVLFLVMDFECGWYILSRRPRFMSPSLLQNLWSD